MKTKAKLPPVVAPRVMGRPTKATPATFATLAAAIALGLTDEQAAALAGIHRDTLTEWRKADGEFSGAIKKATALRLAARLERIERGEPGWQGVAWILERTMREQFLPPTVKKQVDHSVSVDGTVTHVVTAEEMEKTIAARRRYQEQVALEVASQRGTLLANGQG